MSRLSEILPVDQLRVRVDASNKKKAFDLAAQLFADRLQLDAGMIADSLFARESLGSTGLGAGVAIPHARIKGLTAPAACLLQLSQPIDFNAPDRAPVSLLVFLLVPEAATGLHLQLLSEVATLLDDDTRRQALKTGDSPAALHGLLAGATPG